MPAQPPFLIPTRRPATGLPAASVNSRTRAAAASVKVITCRRNSRDAISNLHRPGARPGGYPTYSTEPAVLTGRPGLVAKRERLRSEGRTLVGRMQNPQRKHGDDGRYDENRTGSNDEIDVTTSVGGHHEPERHENAADGNQDDVHGFVLPA